MPTAEAGTFRKLEMLPATAFAAMAAVPSVLVRLETDSLPIWNMPFSMPAGMPTFRMRLMRSRSGFRSVSWSMRSAQSGFCSRNITVKQAIIRLTRLAVAAPITPMPNL